MSGASGKVVLVTGAARGIGAELARVLARRGARLALLGLEPERLRALARELGEDHRAYDADVTDQASLDRAVRAAVGELGGLDVVVANAGVANNGTVRVNPPDALARTVEVNLIGVIRTVSATLPHVEARRGHYLIVSSASAFRAMPGMAAYAASKIGVDWFADALRLENAHKGVTVGVAYPSWIETDLVRDLREELAAFREMLRRLPWPFSATTSVEDCAAALAEGIERRRRKIYVPRSLALFDALRSMLTGPLADRVLARHARTVVPALEEEVRALGRSFGTGSVERDRAG